MLLFTAQRLSGYMTLYLYQRLPYDDLVLLAHFFGGAGLIAVCTLGTAPIPFRLRAVPVMRAVVDAGWLIGSVLVLLLWWACTPAWRPESDVGLVVAVSFALVAIGVSFRPIERAISARPHARGWKIAAVVLLWQAYSIDWELQLNFLKDDQTLVRPGVQWVHLAVDLAATATGLAWTLWAQRRKSP